MQGGVVTPISSKGGQRTTQPRGARSGSGILRQVGRTEAPMPSNASLLSHGASALAFLIAERGLGFLGGFAPGVRRVFCRVPHY